MNVILPGGEIIGNIRGVTSEMRVVHLAKIQSMPSRLAAWKAMASETSAFERIVLPIVEYRNVKWGPVSRFFIEAESLEQMEMVAGFIPIGGR